MNYTIRPIGPEDAADTAALRRMPGVFENTLGLPLLPHRRQRGVHCRAGP